MCSSPPDLLSHVVRQCSLILVMLGHHGIRLHPPPCAPNGQMQGLLGTYELLRFFHCRFEQERLYHNMAAAAGISPMLNDTFEASGEQKNAFDLTQATLPPQ